MRNLTQLTAAVILTVLSSACSTGGDRPVTGGPDAEEAAIRLESSRREYQDCVRNEAPGQPDCDSLDALYKKDREVYEKSQK